MRRTPEGSRDKIKRLEEELEQWSELFLLIPPGEWIEKDHIVYEFETVKEFIRKHAV